MAESIKREASARKITWQGLWLNIGLTAIKAFAGFWGNSSAMVADALHSLSDLISDFVVLLSFRFSCQPPDEKHNYGHGKFETLAAAILSLILSAVGFWLAWSGLNALIHTLHGDSLSRPGMIAIWAAVLSIVVKEILFRATLSVGKRIQSDAVIANAWHHRSDAFSSIASLLGISGARFLGEGWQILDPIAAIFVSYFILKVGLGILRGSMEDILESALSDDQQEEILSIASEVNGINEPHNLRTRKIGNIIAIDLHVRVHPEMIVREAHNRASEIERKLRDRFGAETFISIHIEPIK